MNSRSRGNGRLLLVLYWLPLGLALSPFLASAAADHRPSISWLADQRRAATGGTVGPFNFVVGDAETAATNLVVTVDSSNPTLLPANNLTFGGSGSNRTVTLAPVAAQWGWTTVTLTVSDGVKTTATSFTLTVATNYPANTPPVMQGVANTVLPTNTVYGPLGLVVKDDETTPSALTLACDSSNPTLVPTNKIVFGGKNRGRKVTVTPATGQTGRSTITLAVSDATNTTRTSFVLEVVASNTPPTLVAPSNQIVTLGSAPVSAPFTVGDAETAASDLLVAGTSSNTNLLPNANLVFGGSGSNRTVTLAPQPGVTGAATVTLAVTDTDLTTRQAFLFVVYDPASPTMQFQRPRGVFILDSANGGNYTTTFGSNIVLRDGNLEDLPFVDGFTLRARWNSMEGGLGQYDFFVVSNLLNQLPAGQKLSILLAGGNEPDYIAATPGVTTWNDGGTNRAVPWDPFLQSRYHAMVQAMAAYTVGGVPLAQHPRIVLFNPYLPGGFTGFRDPNSTKLQNIPGYSRTNILNAGRNALLAWQSNFPGKMVQIGFWKFLDTENANYGGLDAWEWVREQILAEFNGTNRPRVGFFNENLASKRIGPAIDPYSGTPTTTYAAAMYASQSNAWNGFQMLGNWTAPFNDAHVDNTLNGTPADALEYAFNTYGAEYFEVYLDDLNNAAMQPALTRWHEFFLTGVTTAPSNTPPTITILGNQTNQANAIIGPLAFTIGDAQTPASNLVVTAASSNPILLPVDNIVFGGSGSNRTVTLTPASNQTGIASITLTVFDGALTANALFSLTVFPIPNLKPLTLPGAGLAQVQWSSQAGIRYQLRFSPDLEQWFDAGPPITATNALGLWVDDGAWTGSPPNLVPRRFYRVKVVD